MLTRYKKILTDQIVMNVMILVCDIKMIIFAQHYNISQILKIFI